MIIKNVSLNGVISNIEIKGNKFSKIYAAVDGELDKTDDLVLDATGKAILPSFYNGHTHAAMNLLRGYADDLELMDWLNNHIWPMEAKFNSDHIYAGTRLAILEMIKSGTVFFNDMYWNLEITAKAIEELGVRATLSVAFIETGNAQEIEDKFILLEKLLKQNYKNVNFAIAPHAIYTVSDKLYQRCKDFAKCNNILLHTHLSETEFEFSEAKKNYGKSPVKYLYDLGVLDNNTIAAHMVHLDDDDVKIIADTGVVCVHNPRSNMKLSSGHFQLAKLKNAGCRIVLGTDGAASNNNLSMIEEMRVAALLSKHYSSPSEITAEYIYNLASFEGANAFGIKAGKIEEGYLADAILVDTMNERLVPGYNLISDMVYSADSSCVDTVICDGRIIMQNRRIEDEISIIKQAISSKNTLG